MMSDTVTERAGFWIRTLASLIDTLILIVPIGLLYFLLLDAWFEDPTSPAEEKRQDRVMEVIGLSFVLAYTALEFITAATPGKMVLRLRITDQAGRPAERSRLVLRWTTKQFPLIASLLASIAGVAALEWLGNVAGWVILIGCLAVLRESKLAWHDEWSSTAVIRPRQVEQRGFDPILPPESPDVAGGSTLAE